MNKNQLIQLIKECIHEHYMLNEGAITGFHNIAKNIVDKFKTFYTSSSTRKQLIEYLKKYSWDDKFNPYIDKLEQPVNNQPIEISTDMGFIKIIRDFLNENYFDKLDYSGTFSKNSVKNQEERTKLIKSLTTSDPKLLKGDSPLPIKIDIYNSGKSASYSTPNTNDPVDKAYMMINLLYYFIKLDKIAGKAFLIDPKHVDYEHLIDSLEHEFVHFQQHLRSDKPHDFILGKWNTASNKGIVKNKFKEKELKNMLKNPPPFIKSPGDDLYTLQQSYLQNVIYFNTKGEIMTQARDFAHKHLINSMKDFLKGMDSFGNSNLRGRYWHNHPADLERLKKYLRKKSITDNDISNTFSEYKFLTPSNKKDFLKYVGQYIQYYINNDEWIDHYTSDDSPINPFSTPSTKKQPVN